MPGRIFLLLLLCFSSFQIIALEKKNESDFQKNFSIAKQHLSQREIMKALPYLLYLEKQYPANLNIKYLIGVCYAEESIVNPTTLELLKSASTHIALDYNPNDLEEDRVPIYVHYYLSIAFAQNRMCEEAEKSRNDFLKVYPYKDEYYLEESQKWLERCHTMDSQPPDVPLPVFPKFKPFVTKKESVSKVQNISLPVLKSKNNDLDRRADEEQTKKEKESIFDKIIKTKKVNYSITQPLYSVQLGAFKEAVPVSRFKSMKNVDAFMDNDGWVRYVVGHFSIYAQAESLLKQIASKGYTDAFVVDINSKKQFENEVISINNMNIKYNPYNEAEYRVQLGAFEENLSDNTANIYTQVEGIQEHRENGMTFLTVGKFDSYTDAKEYALKMKDAGMHDAFVIVINKGRKASLQDAGEFNN